MTAEPTITVYDGGPACQKCKLTKRAFDKAGVGYAVVELDTLSADELQAFRDAGHGVAPVVEIRHAGEVVETWSDLRPDRIKAAILRVTPQEPETVR